MERLLKSIVWSLLAGLMPTVCPAAIEVERIMVVTAYCGGKCCCGQYGGKLVTASGYKIKAGDKLCAAPRNLKFGTMIDIPGYGRVPVLDRGGAIKGNRLDVYFPTHKEAKEWGRKTLKVKVSYK